MHSILFHFPILCHEIKQITRSIFVISKHLRICNIDTQIKSHSIVVRWNDAPIGHFLANYDGNLSFEYTIDIDPGPSAELGLKSVLYRNEDQTCNGNTVRGKL